MQDMTDFMREFLDYYFTQVHTSIPGVVTEYDAKKRRAIVQPSLKRRAGNKEYIAFPLLIDVPVQYPGTKKWTIHFPLEEGDEVAIYFSERSLEAWKDVGQDGIEDPDPRRYDLCDAYCVPGLQPQEFISATEPGLQIIHRSAFNGDFISQVLMDDNKIESKYKGKAVVTIDDDHINGKTEKCFFDMTKGNIQVKNGKDEITMMDGDVDIKSPKPIGINGGGNNLNAGSLSPYWTAENTAFTALDTIVSNPMLAIQMAILDGMSGGLGQVIALGTGLIALCKAVIAEDEAAKASSKPIIK
jgi:hypothetical protein